jgi:hypothetical protein
MIAPSIQVLYPAAADHHSIIDQAGELRPKTFVDLSDGVYLKGTRRRHTTHGGFFSPLKNTTHKLAMARV